MTTKQIKAVANAQQKHGEQKIKEKKLWRYSNETSTIIGASVGNLLFLLIGWAMFFALDDGKDATWEYIAWGSMIVTHIYQTGVMYLAAMRNL